MLNRYGLVDVDIVDRILGEQSGDLGEFKAKHADTINSVAQDNAKISKVPGEKSGFLAGRFKSMSATDSKVTDKRGDRDNARQTLRSAHERSGMTAPFHQVFDQKTTGLKGSAHIDLLAYLHDGQHSAGKDRTGKAEFMSPGDAQNFARAVSYHHNDLASAPTKDNPNVVSYKPAPPKAAAPQAPAQPPQGGQQDTGGPMGAPMGTPGQPAPVPPLY